MSQAYPGIKHVPAVCTRCGFKGKSPHPPTYICGACRIGFKVEDFSLLAAVLEKQASEARADAEYWRVREAQQRMRQDARDRKHQDG